MLVINIYLGKIYQDNDPNKNQVSLKIDLIKSEMLQICNLTQNNFDILCIFCQVILKLDTY